MNNWKPYNLEQLAYYYNGMAFKPDDWKGDGIKIIRIEQLNNPTGHYDYYQGEVSENNEINNEDLIFSWSATLKVAIWKHGYGVLNQHLFKVVPKEIADKYFLYYLLDANMEKLGESSHGLTMKHIKRGELEKYIVSIPEKPEQQQIAKILSTADAVIEKTQAAIAKYKAIKQGMLHDLFTRGIDLTTNKLRPRYQDVPELYKESKLGMIPREWEEKEFSNFLDFISYGFTNPMPETQDGPYLVTAANVNGGRIQYETARKTSQFAFDTLLTDKSRPKVNDILLTKDGTLGRIAIVERENLCINQSVAVLRPNKLVNPNFLKILLESPTYQKLMLNDSRGSAIKHIYITDVDKMKVAFPSLLEQEKIAKRLIAMDNKLQTEQTYLQKMQSLKKGLMEDLLSGRKQVKVNDEFVTQNEN